MTKHQREVLIFDLICPGGSLILIIAVAVLVILL
jgi:hypothetical protein